MVRRARSSLWSSKQFVLVGATMPNAGLKNIENHVQRQWPSAMWVRTGREHREKAQLRQFFVRVTPDQRGDALRNAVMHGPPGRAIVFANTIASAESAFEHLQGVVKGALFHKEIPIGERRDCLAAFQAGELPVLVCTGLAARGIDFADVGHVVQFELALNAVEFMHRVGRTARAGKSGVATNIFDEDNEALASALKVAIEEGRSIDHLFSRKRSFRKKMQRVARREEDVTDVAPPATEAGASTGEVNSAAAM